MVLNLQILLEIFLKQNLLLNKNKSGVDFFMENLLIAIANGLVENKEDVNVTVSTTPDNITVYHLHTAKEDTGRVIGKNGRIIHAIRTIMRAAASKQGIKISVEVE